MKNKKKVEGQIERLSMLKADICVTDEVLEACDRVQEIDALLKEARGMVDTIRTGVFSGTKVMHLTDRVDALFDQ